MKAGFLVAIVLLVAFPSIAQENFKPGTIITLAGEQVTGLIDDRDWERNPTEIRFKAGIQEAVVNYAAHQLEGFEVNGRHYLGRIVRVDKSATKAEDMVRERPGNRVVVDTLFLEVLVEATPSLLTARDENGKLHFFYTQNGAINELILKKTLVNAQSVTEASTGRQVVTTEVYKGQLGELFKDCPSVLPEVKRTRFATSDLVKLFSQYATCKGQKYIAAAGPGKINWSVGVTAGLFASTLRFASLGSLNFPSRDYKSLSIPAGMSLEGVLPKQRGKHSIYSELLFHKFSYSHQSNAAATFEFTSAKLNSLFRISSADRKKIGGFLNMGLSYGRFLQAKGPLYDYRKAEFAALIGGGIRLNALSLELRSQATTGFSPFIEINDISRSLYLLVNWQF